MSKKHTYVTKAEKKRRAKKKKERRIARNVLAGVLAVALVVFRLNWFISSRYQHGKGLDDKVLTRDDLKDDVVNVLVCGLDWEEDRTAMMTDVILYVSIDVKDNKVTAFQIPRDTYIGADAPTGGSGKINGVYWFGDDKKDRINNIARVINEKLGLPIDHYATLDMEAFISLVDSIDNGLDMYVPYPIITKDRDGNEVTIIAEPGWTKVSGETAERIVRNRNYPNADVQRLEVQSYFYAALVKYFMENFDISDFIKIMGRFTQYITTDMHWTRIASIAKFGLGVEYRDIKIVKPPVHGYNVQKEGSETPTNYVVADKQRWADLLNEYCRPHQDPVDARDLKIPGKPPRGEVTRDFGLTEESIQSIADIMAKSPEK